MANNLLRAGNHRQFLPEYVDVRDFQAEVNWDRGMDRNNTAET
jgi:hypothetical protein